MLTGCLTPVPNDHAVRSISVTGEGVVSTSPDTAQFTVGYSTVEDSTQEAQQLVAEKMNAVMEIMRERGIPEDQISLLHLRISPEYEWKNGQRVLAGQKVSQSLSISIEDISTDARELAGIFDELGKIQGIEISSVTFSVSDPRELYREARKIALRHGAEKAEEIAEQSGMTLLKPLRISEERREQPVVREFAVMEARDAATVVPPGKAEFTSRLSIEFEME